MSEPQLFVGEREKLVLCATPPLGNLHVETARGLQSADLSRPYEIKPVVAPAAGYLDDQLLVAGAVMRPVVGDDDLFDKIDGVTRKRGGFDNGNRCHQALLGRLDAMASEPVTGTCVTGSRLPMYKA